ncbi:Retrovirus-related Pol polyprotein from transposon RE2 [Vitis vinifera]|uniref:Retrovirus-related Pol polyprotein from transposon RE2 n=1 Tax=Vitis vinifera TaxID=29760 RepID=A0A438EGQ5_VITVI|nr:Retrovirus-related Pol polyprotein from transposon RE2 [Vitis vinifera]
MRAREAFSGDTPLPPASPDADQPPYIPDSPIRALHVPLLGIFVSIGPPNSLFGETPATFSPPQSLHVPWECSSTFLVWKIIFPGLPLLNFGLLVKDMRTTWLPRRQISLRVDRVQWRKIDAQLCSVLWQSDLDLSTYIGQIASLKEEFLTVMPLTPDVGAQQTQLDKFFMVLTLIGLRRSGTRGRGQRPHRTYCNKLGHTHDRCYQLHGRPPRTIHMAQSSDSPLPQPPSSSASQISQASIASVAQPGSFLLYYYYLCFTLANGSQTVAKGIGLALPLPFLPLTSVLYTPECRFNLISISKLTRTLNCSITFSDKFVTLHDRSTGKTIDIGRESQGLYHLTSDSSLAVCISTDAPLLIHNRLGHPSLSKFQKMVPRFSTCRRFRKFYAESKPSSIFLFVCYAVTMPGNIFSPIYFVYVSSWDSSSVFLVLILLNKMGLQKGYRCYSLETHRYFIFADVTFFEDSPFFSTTSESLPVSEVLLLPIVSPADVVPPRPLQVYHRRPRVAAPLLFAEAPVDSLPTPSASPAPALPSLDDLPIAIRKGTCSTHNPHPIYNFLSYHRLSSPYSAFVSAISSVSLPKSTHEALSYPGWRQAMVDEMAALHSNGTWDLVVLPSGKSTIGCRWVYAVKVGPDGQVDHFKARLVAKGYTQVYDSDYGDTFSLVAKIASVRLLLSMAAMCSWPLYQLDIKNAFLHGDLVEEVYMEQPPGFVAQGESGLVCSTANHLVFYHHNSLGQCIYLTKDLGKLKYFLGIEIAQSSSGVVLSQRKYALDILEETGMLDCKPVDTPMDPNVKLVPGQGEPLGDPRRYRRLVAHQAKVCCTRTEVILRLLVTQMQIRLAHPQIDVPLQGTVFLLEELRFGKDEQMKLICDNQAALHIASNPVFHERTKHIEVDCHFIREKIASGCVATSFVNSNDQLADIFTKSLRGPRIKYICNKLGAYDIYAPA